ncbi:nucleoside-diphosphate sugar epimerase [Jiangella anatolica]|uniref:Nucleoside-diphosphate sugar epimerase n=2 Tax=Jiangella anatolica TaxID=2670374 RepID=A0A2W2B896_9ACTN|nr:nucleoside-diphosphate sugar epimerase [Jiangella anatolica]
MMLVTGATGTVGRPLINLLRIAGADVRAVSRDVAAADLPADVEVVDGDPARPDTLAAALDGVTSLFLHPRAVGDAAAELADLARRGGVRRIVALSATNVDDDLSEQPSRFAGDRNREAEEAAAGSGLEWTSLRVSFFAANTIAMWGAQIRNGDVVRYPYPDVSEAPIHQHDIAGVAAQALLTDELIGRRVVLTGPQSLTHAEMVGVIGDVLGRPLRYEEIGPGDAVERLVAHGLPEPFAVALMARYGRLSGTRQPVSDDVETILGRPAGTFARWVAGHAAAFAVRQERR